MENNPPHLSVIIPAYNEADWLGATLRSLNPGLEQLDVETEVIVVDNNSEDNTAEIASGLGAKVVSESENIIARARNTGAREANGDWYLFVDADTLVPPDLLGQILKHTREEPTVGGGALLAFREEVASWLVNCGLAAWNWISSRFSLAAGSIFWVEGEAFEAAGGFNETVYASEEIWLSLALKREAKRSGRNFKIIARPRAKTSARKFLKHPTWKLVGALALFVLLPFSIFSRKACGWFWYE